MKLISFIITTFLLLFSTISFAQQADNKPIKTIYSYSFFAEMDVVSIDKVEQEVKLLTGVTDAKIKYKPENKTAQLIVIVKEKKRSSEGEVLFQPTDLKSIISKNGYTPNELSTEILSN